MEKNKIDHYEIVFNHDRNIFLAMDKETLRVRTDTFYSPDHTSLLVPMLNRLYSVSLTDGTILSVSAPKEIVPVATRLLILHYFIYSKDHVTLSHDLIPFHSIRGISHFETAFLNDALPPLKRAFSDNLPEFISAGLMLKGELQSYGDASIRLWLFPKIPITYILWKGDEEFPMNMNILFDRLVTSCTHPEDVPVLGSYGAKALAECSGSIL